MSNEELAVRIQAGETYLMEDLLARNKGITYRIAMRYAGLAQRNRGVDLEDLAQSCRLGMMQAVYAHDPERGSFLTIAAYYMQREVRQALGIHSAKPAIESTQAIASLNALVGEDGDAEQIELLADENAIDPQESTELSDLQCQVRAAVEKLPQRQREVVKAHFLQGVPYSEMPRLGSYNGLVERARTGIKILRHNQRLRELWQGYEGAPHQHRTLAAWRYTHTSAVEQAAIRREEIQEHVSQSEALALLDEVEALLRS